MRFRERLRQLCVLQLCVLDPGLRQEGDARVCIFPQRKKPAYSFFAFAVSPIIWYARAS